MRLDHLLSKEHLALADTRLGSRATSQTNVLRWLLISGALAIRSERRAQLASTVIALWCNDMESGTEVATRPSTLLGPEGTAAGWSPQLDRIPVRLGEPRWGAGTARILRTAQWTRASSVVAKLVRAHGGCLGTRSRRRTLEPAISPGESATRLRSGDFRMGKPNGRNGPLPLPEHIGQVEETWGSETSQYPQEEKAIAIP